MSIQDVLGGPAYIAGLFDGEGSVVVHSNRRGTSHQLRVSFGMCDPEPIEFLKENYGGEIHRNVCRSGRPLFVWHANGRRALELLEDILPFTLGKRAQVIEALKFPWSGYKYGGSKESVPSEILAERRQVGENLKRLKEPRDV